HRLDIVLAPSELEQGSEPTVMSIIDDQVFLSRMTEGPLAAHIGSFVGSLREQGYALSSIRRHVSPNVGFNRWLKQKGIAVRGTRHHSRSCSAVFEISRAPAANRPERSWRSEQPTRVSGARGRHFGKEDAGASANTGGAVYPCIRATPARSARSDRSND